MDNQSNESSSGELSVDAAGDIFNNMFNGDAEVEKKPVEAETEEAPTEEPEPEVEAEQEEPQGEDVTIEIDGKKVTLTQAQIAESYKNGLRQDDYTRKTMDVAEQRKTVEAQNVKATQEREQLAGKLNAYTSQLEYALNEQSQTNWQELLDADPVQYLKEQHLFQDRQAALNNARQDQAQLLQLQQQQEQASYKEYLDAQNQALLDKLPAWKDDKKRIAETTSLKNFLNAEGFNEQDISQVTDYRHVLLIRDAMKFRELLKTAPDVTKRVQTAPIKAERSGTTDKSSLDNRTTAMKRFSKSGSVEDAGAVFASLL